jgi:uncharacterized protein (DUF4415 family)
MKTKPFSPDELEHLAALAALPDDQIDTSDIPETTAEQWKFAQRPGLYKPIKQPVTMRLDADVVAWFKDHADGQPYQTEINRVLRQHVVEATKRRA